MPDPNRTLLAYAVALRRALIGSTGVLALRGLSTPRVAVFAALRLPRVARGPTRLPACVSRGTRALPRTGTTPALLVRAIGLERLVVVLGVGGGARGVALLHTTVVGTDAENRRCHVEVGGQDLLALRRGAGYLADAVALCCALVT